MSLPFKVHSMVEQSLIVMHMASAHAASTEEPGDLPGEMMLCNKVLGQQILSYRCRTVVPKAAIQQLNNWKQGESSGQTCKRRFFGFSMLLTHSAKLSQVWAGFQAHWKDNKCWNMFTHVPLGCALLVHILCLISVTTQFLQGNQDLCVPQLWELGL